MAEMLAFAESRGLLEERPDRNDLKALGSQTPVSAVFDRIRLSPRFPNPPEPELPQVAAARERNAAARAGLKAEAKASAKRHRLSSGPTIVPDFARQMTAYEFSNSRRKARVL